MLKTNPSEIGGIQWTHFLDEELRRYRRTKRCSIIQLIGHPKKKEISPHHFFMTRELVRVGANKKQVLLALFEARADYLQKSEEHQWWSLPFFGIKKHECYSKQISAGLMSRIEESIWTIGCTPLSAELTGQVAESDKIFPPYHDETMIGGKSGNHDEVNQAEIEIAIEDAEGIARIEIPKTTSAPICVVGNVINEIMAYPEKQNSMNHTTTMNSMPVGIRHMMRFSARGGAFKDGFSNEPTAVRRFAAVYTPADAKKKDLLICTLIEETKTSHEWMFYIHTSRPARTEVVCAGLIMANMETYPNLRGTFLADNMRYMDVKRPSFHRLQHFRFFSMAISQLASIGPTDEEKT